MLKKSNELGFREGKGKRDRRKRKKEGKKGKEKRRKRKKEEKKGKRKRKKKKRRGTPPKSLLVQVFFFYSLYLSGNTFSGENPLSGHKNPLQRVGVIRHPSLVWNGDWRRGVSPP